MKRNLPVGCIFAVAGVMASAALWFMVGFGNAWSGWGDGATVRHEITAMRMIAPWAVYFVCGFMAALSVRRGLRWVYLAIAHLSPWFTLTAVRSSSDRSFMLQVLLVAFAAFAALWWLILRREEPPRAGNVNLN